jgi:chemotaxis protein histidine kinase CheA
MTSSIARITLEMASPSRATSVATLCNDQSGWRPQTSPAFSRRSSRRRALAPASLLLLSRCLRLTPGTRRNALVAAGDQFGRPATPVASAQTAPSAASLRREAVHAAPAQPVASASPPLVAAPAPQPASVPAQASAQAQPNIQAQASAQAQPNAQSAGATDAHATPAAGATPVAARAAPTDTARADPDPVDRLLASLNSPP